MNSVRHNATAKVWTVDDFMPKKKSQVEVDRCATDEEIYAALMKYMPPPVQ